MWKANAFTHCYWLSKSHLILKFPAERTQNEFWRDDYSLLSCISNWYIVDDFSWSLEVPPEKSSWNGDFVWLNDQGHDFHCQFEDVGRSIGNVQGLGRISKTLGVDIRLLWFLYNLDLFSPNFCHCWNQVKSNLVKIESS